MPVAYAALLTFPFYAATALPAPLYLLAGFCQHWMPSPVLLALPYSIARYFCTTPPACLLLLQPLFSCFMQTSLQHSPVVVTLRIYALFGLYSCRRAFCLLPVLVAWSRCCADWWFVPCSKTSTFSKKKKWRATPPHVSHG